MTWLLFVLAYGGGGSLIGWRTVLEVEPVAVLALVFTHVQHGLFWPVIEPVSAGGIQLFQYR